MFIISIHVLVLVYIKVDLLNDLLVSTMFSYYNDSNNNLISTIIMSYYYILL
jgi:hypothetical protein